MGFSPPSKGARPDWVPTNTAAIEVFERIHAAWQRGEPMIPRSASDKEYFAQDWFWRRLAEVGLPAQLSGRNTYPDFWLTLDGLREGYEVKSLAVTRHGQPARSYFDANSTIPSGVKAGSQVLIAFFLYTGDGGQPRQVH